MARTTTTADKSTPTLPRKLGISGIDRPPSIRRELIAAEARAAQLRELLSISERLEAAEQSAIDRVSEEISR